MTKSTKEVNVCGFIQLLAKGRLNRPPRKAGYLEQSFHLLFGPVCQGLRRTRNCRKAVHRPPLHFSLLLCSVLSLQSHRKLALKIPQSEIFEQRSNRYYLLEPLFHQLWYNLDNESSTVCISTSIQKNSHQPLSSLKEKVQSNIFIDTHIECFGNVHSLSLHFGFLLGLLQAEIFSKNVVAKYHLDRKNLHQYPCLYHFSDNSILLLEKWFLYDHTVLVGTVNLRTLPPWYECEHVVHSGPITNLP